HGGYGYGAARRITMDDRTEADVKTLCILLLLPGICLAQSVSELGKLSVPSSLELAPDGATLWYKFGPGWWEVATAPNSKPKRVEARQAVAAVKPPGLNGTSR